MTLTDSLRSRYPTQANRTWADDSYPNAGSAGTATPGPSALEQMKEAAAVALRHHTQAVCPATAVASPPQQHLAADISTHEAASSRVDNRASMCKQAADAGREGEGNQRESVVPDVAGPVTCDAVLLPEEIDNRFASHRQAAKRELDELKRLLQQQRQLQEQNDRQQQQQQQQLRPHPVASVAGIAAPSPVIASVIRIASGASERSSRTSRQAT